MFSFDRDNPKLVRLTRKVADELTVLACLMPLAMTDIAVPFSQDIFCTDTSNDREAILKATVSSEVAEVLWKCTRSKGAYSRLLTHLETALKRLGELEELTQQHAAIVGGTPNRFSL